MKTERIAISKKKLRTLDTKELAAVTGGTEGVVISEELKKELEANGIGTSPSGPFTDGIGTSPSFD